ncbi:ROK family protein [uncultured Maribacter sp.]|uniref:ROK family protein n=1 Tax=uncultured Maribacter sp. TaxID=431308 RepID=UPI0030EEF6A5|tara:strand:+ start:149198 stop:150043 length:846 start_codon:yes stop_codon:yes gene_type:complete
MSMMQEELLGVDIGGTNIKIGKVVNGVVVQKCKIRVNRDDLEQVTLDNLYKGLKGFMTDSVKAIGIGVPAVVDIESGTVYDVQNIPSWTQIALKDLVEEKFNVPVYINNDANCFAIGEKRFGKAQEFKNCIALSLGTGMGMGIIINDKLYNGVLCGAGEIGMVPYLDGILEEYTGSFFFEREYKSSALSLYNKALEGDEKALLAFNDYGIHLAEAIKIILYMYAPEAIILGGSISNSFQFFEKSLKTGLESFAYQKQIENLKIQTSDLVDSPILGAAALCL